MKLSDEEEFERRLRSENDMSVLSEIRLIRKGDDGYPPCFLNYPRMPGSIYVRGRLPDPSVKTVAIVGARNCTSYGRNQAEYFGRTFAQHGIQVISGMAYGIDSWGQKGALDGGGKVWSVLGTGVDVCYPRQNYPLYRRIIREGGGIISEYPPGTLPDAWHFPIRNRIISALSDVVLVVEARLKSGSLITADYAMEQGKSIYAVPGRNGDTTSEGCNRLIAQGAGIAWVPEAILEELGFDCSEACAARFEAAETEQKKPSGQRKKKKNTVTSPEADLLPEPVIADDGHRSAAGRKLPGKWAHCDDFQKLYRHLSDTPKTLDTLQEESGLDLPSLTSVVMQLCISGYAAEAAPGFYVKIPG